MKWLGYLLSVIVSISLVVLIAIIQGPAIYFVSLYAGLFIYWSFRPTWNDRIPALKKIAIVGAIFTVLLIIESLVLQNLANQVQSIGTNIVSMFATPSILFVIGLGVIFVAIPALLAFLDGLTQPDQEELIRNSLLVLAYVILTLGIYQIYWFWLIKKGLRNSSIQTTSLWWFLLPIVGAILIYIDFSKALEQRTQRKFITWFLIFFFFQGLDVVINQAILNHDLLKQKV
jgi:hypothetical protein